MLLNWAFLAVFQHRHVTELPKLNHTLHMDRLMKIVYQTLSEAADICAQSSTLRAMFVDSLAIDLAMIKLSTQC